MLLDSRLNLFNIIANLCSKLHYEVQLKSENYIVNISKVTLYVEDLNSKIWLSG